MNAPSRGLKKKKFSFFFIEKTSHECVLPVAVNIWEEDKGGV